MTAPHFELFSHASDMGVRGFGNTIEEAFEQAAMALSAMVTDLNNIEEKEFDTIECKAPDLELLLMDWLNAIIYEMVTKKMVFKKFNIELNELSIKAKLSGEKINIAKHSPVVEPKAATFTELKVEKISDGFWLAQDVIDV